MHYHPFLGTEPEPDFVDEEELGQVEGQKFVVDERLFNM